MLSLLRSPTLHFVLAGALLFACDRAWEHHAAPNALSSPRGFIVISSHRVDATRTAFAARWGSAPARAQLDALIRQAADDEMLFREARRLGLDRQDGSIRLRLIQKARAVSEAPEGNEA